MVLLLSLLACKKEVPPEPAAEPVVIDMATAVTIEVLTPDVTRVSGVCKDTGERAEAVKGAGKEVVLPNLSGENCMLTFEPNRGTFSPVAGGETWICSAQEGKDVSCKAR
ncbi:MAG: hypothetical protein ACI9VR_001218 [Cognaticolwellia sp.]|jgi:hypothetical protein